MNLAIDEGGGHAVFWGMKQEAAIKEPVTMVAIKEVAIKAAGGLLMPFRGSGGLQDLA